MSLCKKKTNKTRTKRKSTVKSNAKKYLASKVDEGEESEKRESSPSPKKDSPIKSMIYQNVKLSSIRDKTSSAYQDYVNEFLNTSSSDEDIFEKSGPRKSVKNAQESDELHSSIKNLTISQHRGRTTRSRSQSLSVCEEAEKPGPKVPKLCMKKIVDNSGKQRYSLRNVSEERTFNETIKLENDVEETASSLSPSTKKRNVILIHGTPTRRSSVALDVETNGYNTPNRTRSASKRTTRNSRTQSPVKNVRHLRERNSINYNEASPRFDEKPPATKPQAEEERESIENKITETPRKRGRPKTGTPSTTSLPRVNEESIEKYPSSDDESFEDFSPRSQVNMGIKRSSRRQKSVADRNSDYIYEGSPKKRRSIMANTPTRRSQTSNIRISSTTTARSTPGRKKAVTPGRNIVTTPKKSITATPKRSTTMTPRGRRTLTPGMHQRSENVPKPKTNFEEFRARLHVSFVPKSLPCREAEFNNIFTFLQSKLTEETGGCIYISGVPGTGKTATVNEVISCLKKLVSKDELPSFKFVDINGMKLTEPRQAYVQIQKSLNGTTTSWEEAHRCLQHRFTTPDSRRTMTLLLIDEMDLLCTKRQDVVYNLLDWPTYKSSRLVVITIANTMDLPERVLMGRVTSRLGLTRLTFQPYSHMQLKEIVTTRLKDSEAFKSEAIELVARKVASVSGDARRALDICRRATEIAESNNKEFVTMEDVTSALTEMIANPRVQAIKCCSIMERKFLEAVCTEVSRTGVDQVTFKNVYMQFTTLCRLDGMDVPNITQALEICKKLASWRLILQESGADLYQSILLNVSSDDVYFSKQKLS